MFNAADTQLADGNTASAIEIFETVAQWTHPLSPSTS